MSAQPRQDETQAALRRGWCPSTLKPMATGDGWLVRLHPPGGELTPKQLARIAELARRHGNGLIEISARGNIQLRGVTERSHPALVAALLAERLVDEHDGDGPQRLTLTSPFAGHDARDFTDAAALAGAIETCARGVCGLPPKIAVVVDGGGSVALDGLSGDLRVRATGSDAVLVALPGEDWRGPIGVAEMPECVATMLRRFAALRTEAPDRINRLRDLAPDVLAALSPLPRAPAPTDRPQPLRAGLFTLGENRFAAMAALPFGRCDADTLAALAEAAARCGAARLRLSPWRGIACLALDEAAARSWLAAAGRLGMIVSDGDPRLSVQACAGAPACLRAEGATMADAALLAGALPALLAAGTGLHVSGCVKSCAHPGAADLTLSARNGRYDVILHGTTRAKPVATLDLSEIMRRLQPGQDLFNRLTTAGSQTEPAA